MAAHIFTVNEKTFKVHLNYMFAGTGKEGADHQIGALADISSVREGDIICFYVMNKGFFGFFKAKGKPFYENRKNQYLYSELDKNLTYRVLIEPYKVFENHKSEWNVIENPKYIEDQSIYNMQWSWIFKKLNANRGCLSIDNYEFELLEKIISTDNTILTNSKNYDYFKGKIVNHSKLIEYEADTSKGLRNNRQLNREEDLRVLFTSGYDENEVLNKVLKPEEYGKINFISNEVLCSFSERKLDIVLGTDKNVCLLIELKNDFIYNKSIYNQIKEYSRWISAYKIKYKQITPILIIKEARELSLRKNSKFFKYLSKKDVRNNVLSPWYQNIVSEINNAKLKLKNEKIDKLNDLKVYVFTTNQENELSDFKEIY